jgi:predicted dehydrogenase
MALIGPAKSHPDVVVQAVAARDKSRAEAYAKKHGIPQVLDSYQGRCSEPL